MVVPPGSRRNQLTRRDRGVGSLYAMVIAAINRSISVCGQRTARYGNGIAVVIDAMSARGFVLLVLEDCRRLAGGHAHVTRVILGPIQFRMTRWDPVRVSGDFALGKH